MDVPLGLAAKVLNDVRILHQLRRRVHVRVHRAFFVGSNIQRYFVNVTNVSAKREVVVTHLWFSDPEFHVINPERPLPKRLALDEPWETWASVRQVGEGGETRARVRLSNGKVVKSRKGSPPPFGSVPGDSKP